MLVDENINEQSAHSQSEIELGHSGLEVADTKIKPTR